METYLGIDGGGSKTRAMLVDSDGKQIHYAESGPSNLNAYDEATVQASLSEAINQCLQTNGTPPTATCFGLAGASSTLVKQKLEAMIDSLKLGRVQIRSDAEIALEGAFSGKAGILLIAGTGSACFGKSADGAIHRTGGWGWLADDSGSGGWIGQRGLQTAVQQNDGRINGHALRDSVFTHLGIRNSEEISAKVYQPSLSRSQLAELSKGVLDLALAGDDQAKQIQQQALDELEIMIRSTAKKLKDEMTTVAFAGGLLMHNPSFREALKIRLFDFEIIDPQSTPIEGAIALARK